MVLVPSSEANEVLRWMVLTTDVRAFFLGSHGQIP